jgi:hypothetical protein
MTAPEGALWSAIDAETGGHEGAFYVWTAPTSRPPSARRTPPSRRRSSAATASRSSRTTRYVLHLPQSWEAAAARRRLQPEALLAEVDPLRERWRAARDRRPRPATDDKVLADWNGIAIAGLAVAGRLLAEPAILAQAARAADFLLRAMRPAGGPLLHVWRQGRARIPAYLADYAFAVRGLLALHAPRRAALAGRRRRPRRGAGGAPRRSRRRLLRRRREPRPAVPQQGSVRRRLPTANAVAILNCITLAARRRGLPASAEAVDWRGRAAAALCAFAPLIEQHPEAVRMLAVAARRFHGGATTARQEAARERGAGAGTLAFLDHEAEQHVQPHLELAPPAAAAADGAAAWRRFQLTLDIAPGWHLQANPASESYLVATALAAGRGVELRGVAYPEAATIAAPFANRPLALYTGRVTLAGEVRPAEPAPGAGADGGDGGDGGDELLLTYQLCDDHRCLPPHARGVAVRWR